MSWDVGELIPPSNDHLFDAPDNAQVSVLVDDANIARVIEAVRRDCLQRTVSIRLGGFSQLYFFSVFSS